MGWIVSVGYHKIEFEFIVKKEIKWKKEVLC